MVHEIQHSNYMSNRNMPSAALTLILSTRSMEALIDGDLSDLGAWDQPFIQDATTFPIISKSPKSAPDPTE
jgi:hypothetical protein